MTVLPKKAVARAYARRNRRTFTDVLRDHGVKERGYMLCTDGAYVALFGRPAHQLRAMMGLPANANLRDHFDGIDLSAVMLVEAMAAKQIQDAVAIGNRACIEVTVETARRVAKVVREGS